MRSLEAQGVPSKQAEAITGAITEVLNDSLENVAQNFVSKAEMQRVNFYLLRKKMRIFFFFVFCFCYCLIRVIMIWLKLELV